MPEENVHTRTSFAGWLAAGWLLTLVVAFLWVLTDSVTTTVIALSVGLGVGIAVIIVIDETLILTTIQALQKAGESAVRILSMRKNMRAVLALWIMVLFTLVVVVTVFGQLELDKFNAIAAVLGGFVASIVAYYFAASRTE